MLQLIKTNQQYRRFWASGWIADLGDWIRKISLMFVVLQLAGPSKSAIPFSLVFEFAPMFLFGPLVSVFSDRWNRKKTVIGTNLAKVVFSGLFIAAIYTRSLPLIMAGTFLASLSTVLFNASSSAFVLQFVEKENMKIAISLRQFISSAMALIGPPMATFIFMKAGATLAFSSFIVCLLVSSGILYTIRTQQTETRDDRKMSGLWREFLNGFQYGWRNRSIRPILYGTFFVGLAAGMLNALEIFIITEFLGLPKTMYPVILSIQGFGMVISSLVIGQVRFSAERLVSVGLLLLGVSLGCMVSFHSFYVLAASYILLAFSNVAFDIGISTMIRTKAEFGYVGRTDTIAHTVMMGCMTVSALGAGILHQFTSVRILIAGACAIGILGGLIVYTRIYGGRWVAPFTTRVRS